MVIIELLSAGMIGVWVVYNVLDGLADARSAGKYSEGRQAQGS